MFSVEQKQKISESIQGILRATKHPELPLKSEIQFQIHVDGAESWSWADITNNEFYTKKNPPDVNPHN